MKDYLMFDCASKTEADYQEGKMVTVLIQVPEYYRHEKIEIKNHILNKAWQKMEKEGYENFYFVSTLINENSINNISPPIIIFELEETNQEEIELIRATKEIIEKFDKMSFLNDDKMFYMLEEIKESLLFYDTNISIKKDTEKRVSITFNFESEENIKKYYKIIKDYNKTKELKKLKNEFIDKMEKFKINTDVFD